jgi:alanine racemase
LHYELQQTVISFEHAQQLGRAARDSGGVLGVHLKCDTGMARLGFPCIGNTDYAADELIRAASVEGLEACGIFTHFAESDAPESPYTKQQFACFQEVLEALRVRRASFPLCHAANSAATILNPETHLDLVRPGLVLYGIHPCEATRERCSLTPVMTFQSTVSQLRTLAPGQSVSYGRTFTADRPLVIAVVEAGYGDGLFRLLSNRGSVLIRGQRARLVGNICMDRCMVDVTDLPSVEVGDSVVFFGTQDHSSLPVEEQADLVGTIPYELLCAVSTRVPRVYSD